MLRNLALSLKFFIVTSHGVPQFSLSHWTSHANFAHHIHYQTFVQFIPAQNVLVIQTVLVLVFTVGEDSSHGVTL